jgi:malonyl CoA-acyl carrier protein transacylase
MKAYVFPGQGAQFVGMGKDLYENFVNVKFKKFIEKYKMPLSNDVSEGYAREVIYQIQKLMNIVSEISVNSYVTAMYK